MANDNLANVSLGHWLVIFTIIAGLAVQWGSLHATLDQNGTKLAEMIAGQRQQDQRIQSIREQQFNNEQLLDMLSVEVEALEHKTGLPVQMHRKATAPLEPQ